VQRFTVNFLAGLAAVCCAISLVYYLFSTVIGLRFVRKAAKLPGPSPKITPRVAVLKPLRGTDSYLLDNLVSFLELDYSKVDFVFGVSDYEDEAASVVVALKPRYPFRHITLVVGERPHCTNRKVAKLIEMVERAPGAEILVLSDADVAVERDHLRRLVNELEADPELGLVTCLYRAAADGGFVSRLAALFVNTDFVPMIMISKTIEPMRYAMGATIAIKRAALASIGGFTCVKDVLADDYYLGKFVSDKGYKVGLSSSIVTVRTHEPDFSSFWNHQLRWMRTYRSTRPISVATIVLHGPFWALMLLFLRNCSKPALAISAVVIATRIITARLQISKVLGLSEQRGDSWLTPVKDLIITAAWVASLFSNKVLWAGRWLRIRSDGTMQEILDSRA
jgi:ceramide glucosyltransferase